MRGKFLVALAIGAAISGALTLIDPYVGFALVSWQMPGAAAAFLFWGMLGLSTFAGLVIAWLVNAFFYAVPIFLVLKALKLLTK